MNTPKRPAINRINTVIDCGDAQIMAEFYSRLLGWELPLPAANGWAAVTSPEGAVFAFQEIEGYEPPVWPWEKGKQGQMIHLDFWVDNLEEGVEFALACGAVFYDLPHLTRPCGTSVLY